MRLKRILIVEDEMIVAMDEKQCIESLGYEVIGIVSSGEEAIKRAEVDKPDLVIMDIVLEGEMDGIQAAWKIRDDYKIPVIFVTAHGDKGLEPGVGSGYIIKPFSVEDLQKHIKAEFEKP